MTASLKEQLAQLSAKLNTLQDMVSDVQANLTHIRMVLETPPFQETVQEQCTELRTPGSQPTTRLTVHKKVTWKDASITNAETSQPTGSSALDTHRSITSLSDTEIEALIYNVLKDARENLSVTDITRIIGSKLCKSSSSTSLDPGAKSHINRWLYQIGLPRKYVDTFRVAGVSAPLYTLGQRWIVSAREAVDPDEALAINCPTIDSAARSRTNSN